MAEKLEPTPGQLQWQELLKQYIGKTSTATRGALIRNPFPKEGPSPPEKTLPQLEVSASVRDISLGGINLVVNRPFEKGAMLQVEVEGAGEDVPRALLVSVLQVTPQGEGSWLLGCSIARELSDEELRPFQAKRVMAPASDGRAWVRFPCAAGVSIQPVTAATPAQFPAKIMNISASGMAVLVYRSFEVGTLLTIQLLDEHEQALLTLQSRVVRVTPGAPGEWLLGCTFSGLLSTDLIQALL